MAVLGLYCVDCSKVTVPTQRSIRMTGFDRLRSGSFNGDYAIAFSDQWKAGVSISKSEAEMQRLALGRVFSLKHLAARAVLRVA